MDDPSLSVVEAAGLVAVLDQDLAHGADDPRDFMRAVQVLAEQLPLVPFRAKEDTCDEHALQRTLRAGAERFEQLLSMIEGCDEWSFRLDDVPAAGPHDGQDAGGRAYLRRRQAAFAEADGIAPEAARFTGTLMRAPSSGVRAWRLLDSGGVAELALLVVRAEVDPTLDHVASRCDALGGSATITGPWPAFSFCDLGAAAASV